MKIKIVERIKGDDLGPQMILHWYSPEIKCRGVVVVDTTISGKSAGGTRMLPDISTEEIFDLAREMTFKYATMGRPRGGGKAGIWADPANLPLAQRESIMRAFGKAIKPLSQAGIFFAGADMGTHHTDLVWVREETGMTTPLPKFWLEEKDGESLDYHFTGYGVVVAAQAGCEFLGMDMSKTKVAIEGFGKVGSGVVRYAAELGAKVVAVSTIKGAIYNEKGLDVGRLIELRKKFDDDLVLKYDQAKAIKKERLFHLPIDILIPGSRPWLIHEKNVDKIQAKLISSGANIPITEKAGERLYKKKVTVIPGFISNSGGALSSQYGGLNASVEDAFRGIKKIIWDNTLDVLRAASQVKVSPIKLAKHRAIETISRWKTKGAPTEEEYAQKLRKAAGIIP